MKCVISLQRPSMTNKVFTIPNIVSLSRLLLAFPIAYSIYYSFWISALILGALAIFSDFIDGYLSRVLNQSSDIGKIIDPVVDSISVLVVMVSLYIQRLLPGWYLKFVILRYLTLFFILSLYRIRSKKTPHSVYSGKISMCIIAITLLFSPFQATLPHTYQLILVLSTLSLSVSFFDYLYTYKILS